MSSASNFSTGGTRSEDGDGVMEIAVAATGGGIAEKHGTVTAAGEDVEDEEDVKTARRLSSPFHHVAAVELQTLPPFPKEGVNIILLKNLCAWAKSAHPDVVTTTDVNEAIVKPWTCADKCSLVELLRDKHFDEANAHPQLGLSFEQGVGTKANYFVSHAWKYNFFELTETLEKFLYESEEDEQTTYFWLDLCANDQWSAPSLPYEWWCTVFQEAIHSIGHTLLVCLPWQAPIPLSRAWCLWEIHSTRITDARLSIILSSSEQEKFLQVLRSDYAQVKMHLCEIDVEKSDSWKVSDRDMIHKVVRETEAWGGFAGVNNEIALLMRQWVVTSARDQLENMEKDTPAWFDAAMILGTILWDQAVYDDAKLLFEQAVEGRTRLLGANNADTLTSQHKLGRCLWKMKLYVEAGEVLRGCYEGRVILLGEGNKETLATVNALGVLYEDMQELAKAEEMLSRAVAGREVALGKTHIDTLMSMCNLATVMRRLNMLPEAEDMYRRAYDGLVHNPGYGIQHAYTLKMVHQIGILYHIQGRLEEAKNKFKAALHGREKDKGLEHEDTQESFSCLREVLHQLNEHEEVKRISARIGGGCDSPSSSRSQKIFMEGGRKSLSRSQSVKIDNSSSGAFGGVGGDSETQSKEI